MRPEPRDAPEVPADGREGGVPTGAPTDESEKVTSASETGRCECGGSESRGPGKSAPGANCRHYATRRAQPSDNARVTSRIRKCYGLVKPCRRAHPHDQGRGSR